MSRVMRKKLCITWGFAASLWTMRIAAIQITTGANPEDNFRLVEKAAQAAASEGARIIVFPEASSQAFSTGRLDIHAEPLDRQGDGFDAKLADLAEELGVVLVAGIFTPADTVEKDGKTINRVYNTVVATDGRTLHVGYDKIHTYDAFDYRESDTVRAGEELVTFKVDDITFGLATCFDIRFPEQFKVLARLGAQVMLVPFSWADGEGKLAQWRTVSAARALDCTSWIVAAGQARPGGNAEAGKESGPTGCGHSCVINPSGVRVAEAGYETEVIIHDLDIEEVDEVRRRLPVLESNPIMRRRT